MGTTSFIGKVEKNGSITGIHCHWGGDINENGKLLHDYYSERNHVNKLISLGRLSSLGPTIGEKINMDNEKQYNTVFDSQCIAYHRDRNEELEIFKNEKLDRIVKYYENVYIYGLDNVWYVYHDGTSDVLSHVLTKMSKQSIKKNKTNKVDLKKYLFVLSNNDMYKCATYDFDTALNKLYTYVWCKNTLFEKALVGMTTDEERIKLFNKFSNIEIQHVYLIEKEIGTCEKNSDDNN